MTQRFARLMIALAATLPMQQARAQNASPAIPLNPVTQSQPLLLETPITQNPASISPLQALLEFKESDVKFNLRELMNTLRDNRHEGWVLAAYPDPKTSRPLIGAGFSLDLPAREHVQRDPSNPNQFLEPSSAQLWQAAGLEPQRLQEMLVQYDRELSAWKKRRFQRKARTHALFPEISDEDAMKLLRISTIQAVHNAKAYCRYFDKLTGPQQMALTQLVFQMGVNLEEFTQFLAAINSPVTAVGVSANASAQLTSASSSNASVEATPAVTPVHTSFTRDQSFAPTTTFEGTPWSSVQETLIHSDWARRYSSRAVAVIAMFDPTYTTDPWQAESRIRAEVHPLHPQRRHKAVLRTASAHHRRNSARRTHKS